jgi:hypothetical protein
MNTRTRNRLKLWFLALPVAERQALARRCGVSYQHLRNVVYGGKSCNLALAIHLDRESHGWLAAEALCPGAPLKHLRAG